MENHLIKKIKENYPNAQIKFRYNREKSLINNFPYKNINVEIKPHSSGLFVFRFHSFEFFEKELLFKCFQRKLNHPKVSKFWITSSSIYLYPKFKTDTNGCFDAFRYTTEEINKIIHKIQEVLSE